MTDDERQRINLEKLTADVGQMLGNVMKDAAPGLGFCLIMFDFGEEGNLAYCSNSRREDMIKVLDVRKVLIADAKAHKKD